jgi:hypothetical protein
MDFLAAGLSTLITVFVLALFGSAVAKLFQIHTVLTEIKEGLGGRSLAQMAPAPITRRPAAVPQTPVALHSMASGEEMLRALDQQDGQDAWSNR